MIAIEPLAAEDFERVAGWLSICDTNRWLTSEWRGRPISPVIIGITVRNKRNRLFLVRCDGQACGLAGFADIDAMDGTAMVWYLLGEQQFAGRGVTTEAVRQLVRVAFDELKLASVYAWIMEPNVRSRRVLERAGFREAGRIRSASCFGGRQVDRIYYDRTAEDSE
jgi:RimJ/RimL family protein N-acetyltransferase